MKYFNSILLVTLIIIINIFLITDKSEGYEISDYEELKIKFDRLQKDLIALEKETNQKFDTTNQKIATENRRIVERFSKLESELVPLGTICAFGGPKNKIPEGWLLCDGRQIGRKEYADLYDVIGNVHGDGNGTTTFHIPDYRGRFLRGVDYNAGRDPDRYKRSVANRNGNTGDTVGSIQEDQMQTHTHIVAQALSTAGWEGNSPYPYASDNTTNVHRWSSHPKTLGITEGRHGEETRPKNAYVNWIIKASTK